jgi:photosystem I P700 chlorophyll a apoprotein A1
MQSDVWGNVTSSSISHITGGNFATSSITINGWLRDFLWAQASQVIQSYGSALSAYGLVFLGAHFIWAFSLMFRATCFSEILWKNPYLEGGCI